MECGEWSPGPCGTPGLDTLASNRRLKVRLTIRLAFLTSFARMHVSPKERSEAFLYGSHLINGEICRHVSIRAEKV